MALHPSMQGSIYKMNRKLRDGIKPSISGIRDRFLAGQYGHEIESTIGVLLERIQKLEGELSTSERQLEWYFSRSFDH